MEDKVEEKILDDSDLWSIYVVMVLMVMTRPLYYVWITVISICGQQESERGPPRRSQTCTLSYLFTFYVMFR